MRRESDRTFLISLDYGDRETERTFVADVLSSFDRNTLVGAVLFINNNPYSLELLFFLNFEKDSEKFESWLSSNYPCKKRVYNVFLDDITTAISHKGYNVIGLVDVDSLSFQMSPDKNDLYFFPDRKIMNDIFGKAKSGEHRKVFLSHSSKDKTVVDSIFNELKKAEVKAWYDRYEIRLGDSITEKINDGLDSCDLGVLFLSENFIYSDTGWTMAEANYFFQKRMKDKNRNFIIVNVDLAHDKIPPLMQDYKYLDLKQNGAIDELLAELREFD